MLARAWAVLSQASLPGRQRWLDVSRSRLLLAALGVGVAVASGEQAWRQHAAQAAAHAAAVQGAAFADERLGVIGDEMAALDRQLGDARTDEGCASRMVHQLIRTTLHSTLVQQYLLVDPQALIACGPEGATAVPRESLAATQHVAMAATDGWREASVLRRRAGGDVLVAVLDHRAFDAGAEAGLPEGQVELRQC